MSLDSIKRRREERLRQLRDQMQHRTVYEEEEPFHPAESWERSSSAASRKKPTEPFWGDEPWVDETEDPKDSLGISFLLKLLASLFILSFTFVIYKIDLPFSAQAQQFVGQVMSREFNFQGTMAKVEQMFGERPSILPVLHDDLKGNIQPVWNETASKEFIVPIQGEITELFSVNGKGVKMTAAESELKAIGEGWVIFVGPKEGLGQTVIIQHGNNTNSWYSGAEQVNVTEQDWVEPGQVIATVGKEKSLLISIEMNHEYVDPMSVIPFE